jgi:hypothetical protein
VEMLALLLTVRYFLDLLRLGVTMGIPTRRLGVLSVAALVLFGLTALGPSATQAAPVPVPASPTWIFTAAPNGTPGAASPNTSAIACTLNVQNAHGSTHVGGTVNVVATISCTPVAASRLSLQVTLYKVVCDPGCYDAAYGKTGSTTNYGHASVQANSAGPCTPGDYFGSAYGSIVSPPGYTPPSGTVSGAGRTSRVTC